MTDGMLNELKRITDSKDAVAAAEANLKARLSKSSVVDSAPIEASPYVREPSTAGLN